MRWTVNVHSPRGYIQTNVSRSVNPKSLFAYEQFTSKCSSPNYPFWGEGKTGGGGPLVIFVFHPIFSLSFSNKTWSGGGVRIRWLSLISKCP